jgi:predicted AAA+ superfamily ATPase
VATQTTNQGAVVEAFVGQELLAAARKDSRPQLHYWVREKKGALAEVDYLIARDSAVIPIEAKSGSSKKTVSMRQFLAEKTQHHAGWHVALHSFGRRDKIIELPFYALFAAAKNWR